MGRLEIKQQLDEADLAQLKELLDAAERADGHKPIDDHRWVDLAQGGRTPFTALLAHEAGHGHPVGYAHVERGAHSWSIELVIDPHHRYEALELGPQLLRASADVIAGEGGGHVHLWVYKPTEAHDAIMATVGLSRGRDLWQMRRPLPLDETTDLVTRPFEPGIDEAAWLDVNNRAFHWHPEQGDWTRDDVRDRESEPWFDPEGFLLHEVDGHLAGFCWTKVHPDHDPPLGEIYVIAVDPAFHGRGLGRALTVAGLSHLAAQGLGMAMLYVDSDNTSAVGLYRDLGFDIDHVDRAFTGDIAAADP
jgi:mycothiol synthase